jgi:membrane protease YdiL (CAAX protease family)
VSSVAALLACGRSPLRYGIDTFDPGRSAWALVVLSLVVLPVVAKAAVGSEVMSQHPELRGDVSRGTVRASALAWGIFLLGYEYVFRGALLWFLVATIGVWPALATTSVLYMLVHLPKDAPGETFVSLLMGFVFGGAALWTGSFVVPWLLHWAIAVLTENLAGRASPDVRWGR